MSITVTVTDGIAIVTLARPEKMNALTPQMHDQLQAEFEIIQRDRTIRGALLTGAGDNFCSGADIGEIGGSDIPTSMERIGSVHRTILAIVGLDKPVIAAVCGVAVGAGWSLALACDIIIAAENARFRFVFSHIGLAPDGGASWMLARQVGLMRAKEIMFSGRFVSGAEAARLGLALEAPKHEDVQSRALELARRYAEEAPLSLAMAKRQFRVSEAQTLEEALLLESVMQPLMTRSQDSEEGIAAYRKRRAPAFRGS